VTRPKRSPRSLTIAEAAEYLGYRATAGIRGLVKKRLLRPFGRGTRDQHLLIELDHRLCAIAAMAEIASVVLRSNSSSSSATSTRALALLRPSATRRRSLRPNSRPAPRSWLASALMTAHSRAIHLDRRSRLGITYLRSIRAVFALSFDIDSRAIRERLANGLTSKKSFGVARRREAVSRTVRDSLANGDLAGRRRDLGHRSSMALLEDLGAGRVGDTVNGIRFVAFASDPWEWAISRSSSGGRCLDGTRARSMS
jgi:hypothetical protein